MPRSPLLLVPLAILLALPACRRGPEPNPGETTQAAVLSPDGVRPLYGLLPDGGAGDPLAAKLCDALQGIPARRRAACCNGAPDTASVTACERLLSAALRAKVVAVEPQAIDACAAAMEQATANCDFLAPVFPTPEPCLGVVRGLLPAKSGCRSSLECIEGLRCVGAGDAATCAPPLDNGAACGEAELDPLAALLR